MKIVVTGTSGYIGSALQEYMLSIGHEITAIGRTNPNNNNIEELRNLTFIKVDIREPFDFELKGKHDIMIHLASANDIDSRSPKNAVMVNSFGTRNCLEFCTKNKINNFIYFSTFQVYGNLVGLISENSQIRPVNDYGISHYFAEEYVKMYARIHNIKYLILRPNNIYGAPLEINIDRWSLVPGCFCKEAFERGQITLESSGKQIRDFCNLNDIIELTNIFCAKFHKYQNNTLNIFSGYTYNIIEIAELVKDMFERMFNKNCNINIRSNLPKSPKSYSIKNNITHSIYKFSGKNSMIKEIEKTFIILKNS